MGKRRGKRKNIKKIESREFDILGKLGSGSYSVVHLCKMKETDEKFAMKVVHTAVSDVSPVYEVHILRKVKHENIVRFLDYTLNTIQLFIHMEYVKGLPLYFIVYKGLINLNTKQILNIMTPLMSALSYLHELKIIHGDVATRNLIVKVNQSKEIETIKLIDFGLACYENKLLKRDSMINDEIAPELLLNIKYTNKIDVWSAGKVLQFLFKQTLPTFLDFWFTLDYTMLLPFIDEQFCTLLEGMLQNNPSLRLPANEILKMLKEFHENPLTLQEDLDLDFLFDNLN